MAYNYNMMSVLLLVCAMVWTGVVEPAADCFGRAGPSADRLLDEAALLPAKHNGKQLLQSPPSSPPPSPAEKRRPLLT